MTPDTSTKQRKNLASVNFHGGRQQEVAVTGNCPPTKMTHIANCPSRESAYSKEEGDLNVG